MSEAFQPKGAISRRQLVLNLLRTYKPDQVIPYEEFHKALNVPDGNRTLVQSTVWAASKEFLSKDKRGLENVRGVGYRVVLAVEHMALAKTHQQKASKGLKKSHQYVSHVNVNELTEAERALFQVVGMSLGQQREFMRRFDIRQQDFEDRMSKMQEQHEERTEEQTSDLQKRLAAMEESLRKAGLLE